jgi:hypothetical protein
MKRFLSFCISFVFFVWILPLGIFVRPSQEKEFCSGARAICLCTHLVAKVKDKGLMKKLISQSSAPVKEEGQGYSHHFLLSQIESLLKSPTIASTNLQRIAYKLLLVRSLDPVPKNTCLS